MDKGIVLVVVVPQKMSDSEGRFEKFLNNIRNYLSSHQSGNENLDAFISLQKHFFRYLRKPSRFSTSGQREIYWWFQDIFERSIGRVSRDSSRIVALLINDHYEQLRRGLLSDRLRCMGGYDIGDFTIQNQTIIIRLQMYFGSPELDHHLIEIPWSNPE